MKAANVLLVYKLINLSKLKKVEGSCSTCMRSHARVVPPLMKRFRVDLKTFLGLAMSGKQGMSTISKHHSLRACCQGICH